MDGPPLSSRETITRGKNNRTRKKRPPERRSRSIARSGFYLSTQQHRRIRLYTYEYMCFVRLCTRREVDVYVMCPCEHSYTRAAVYCCARTAILPALCVCAAEPFHNEANTYMHPCLYYSSSTHMYVYHQCWRIHGSEFGTRTEFQCRIVTACNGMCPKFSGVEIILNCLVLIIAVRT
jgi:hypothetical protein